MNVKKRFKKLKFSAKLFLLLVLSFLVFSSVVTYMQYSREKAYKEGRLIAVLDEKINVVEAFLQKRHLLELQAYEELNEVLEFVSLENFRLTLIANSGEVLYDSDQQDVSVMDNHAQRPEILKALKQTRGHEIRFSKTTQQDYFYYSRKFEKYYIRASVPYTLALRELLVADKTSIYIVLGISLLLILIMRFTVSYFGKMISSLSTLSDEIKHQKEIPHINFYDKQLSDIGNDIRKAYKKLAKTENALKQEKDKLVTHIQVSNQGIAFFSKKDELILSNHLFIQYLNTLSTKTTSNPSSVLQMEEFHQILEEIRNFRETEMKKEQVAIILSSYVLRKATTYFEVKGTLFKDKSFEISIFNITERINEQKLKQDMTSNIAHELRTPISSIQGFLETILHNPDLEREQLRYFIQRSFNQAERLSTLVSDISMLSKIEENANVLETEKLDISQVIQDVYMDLEPVLESENITFKYDFDTPVITQNGNYSLLYSIFRNLTDNSIKYAGADTKIVVKRYLEDANLHYFSFLNTGDSVPEDQIDRIFERFYRVDKGRSRKEGGTGLGLSIVKNAVEVHGGVISAKNLSKGGLEFVFSIKK